MRRLLHLVLQAEGYELVFAETGEEGLHKLEETLDLDLVLTDLQVGKVSGMEILEAMTQKRPDVPVVIMTGYGTVKSAVEAMRKGAYDYISKPVDNEELKIVIKRALELRRLTQDNRVMRQSLYGQFGFDRIVSQSPKMKEILRLAQEVAATDATVLITGESGTGKELLARAIHYTSPRANGPLMTINCAGIPEHLLESELFGYEKGAFTDAKKSKPGRFQLADGGTLFLDEIGTMSMGAQAKLLRVMEDRVVYPLGGVEGFRVDIRILAATNEDLSALMKAGQFRDDLYYRLHVYPLHLPPLRERCEDVPLLLQLYIDDASRERGTRPRRFAREALDLLEHYPWPGNIRELHNAAEWILITCKDEVVDVRHLPGYIRSGGAERKPPPSSLLSFGLSVEELEEAMIKEALDKAEGNVSEASRLLGMTRNTLRYRMDKYGLKGEGSA